MDGWVWTNDPDDPCAYCVGWEDAGHPDGLGDRPYLPSGYVDKVYKGVHRECDESVAAYVAESAAER